MKVFVLTIDTKYGPTVEVHAGIETAIKSLHAFVKNEWKESGGAIPDDPQTAIAAYFARHAENGEDYYSLNEAEVVEA